MKLSEAIYKGSSQIKNIIFDWGGVITDLEFDRCIREFENMGISDFESQFNLAEQNEVYCNFEKGLLSANEFRSAIRELMPKPADNSEIDHAWMSMLAALQKERWELLQLVKNHYRTFLLSNTNTIHFNNYSDYLFKTYGFGYAHLFENVYLSYQLGIRKPDPEIFRYVINGNQLVPKETLFIDDSAKNTEAAEKLGIQILLLQPPLTLTDLFTNGTN